MRKVVLAAVAALVIASPALAATRPVPSLTPAATKTLWRAEVTRARAHPRGLADTNCRPARVVFYAQTDWLRLATKLAQSASPCADYFVSVPPLSADKTQARSGQAALIRALGPNFHALDEISYAGWKSWVTNNASTWFQAGVTARQRMDAAGFDLTAGDTWAMNELSSAVRKGTGTARQDALEFMRGLYTGDGSTPTKGVVFAVGVGQSLPDVTTYKVALQNWLQDTAFWNGINAYASDFAQENYGDIRDYAVAGASPQARRDSLEQYLSHEPTLANAGPDTTATARAALQGTYVSFGTAAWSWSSAYGWTAVPFTTMEDYVSAQVYAGRASAAASGALIDRIGFAWSPNNTTGLSKSSFDAESADILTRLAQAISDSGVPSDDPGSGACAAPPWCTAVLDGAAFTPAWQAFSTWTLPGVGFTNSPATLTAGGVAGPLTVQLQTSGIATNALSDQQVTLTSTSPQGRFAPAAAGPWSPTLTLTIPAGSSSAPFFYSDTKAGTATLSAALPGQPAATQPESVLPGPIATLAVSPATASVRAGHTLVVTAAGVDAYGNRIAPNAAWSLSAPIGQLSTKSGSSTSFTAGEKPGHATLTAMAGGVSAQSELTVLAPPAPVASVTQRLVAGHLVVTATVRVGTQPAARVALELRVRRGSSLVAVVDGKTGRTGRLVWRSKHKLPHARYVVTVSIRSRSTASRTQHASR